RTYPIFIGSGLLNRLPELLRERGIGPDRPLLLVTDTQVAPLYGEKVTGPLRAAGYRVGETTVPAGESSKSLDQLSRLVGEGLRFGLDRQGAVLALGGGVVGDLAGFLAASYMRGILLFICPRSLWPTSAVWVENSASTSPLEKKISGPLPSPSRV